MIEKLAREAYEKGSFNGTWLYAENGSIVSKCALGRREAENKLPMQEDTIFEMASITKMFTATAVMLLVREGKLGLDDEYVKCFPEYSYKCVTIRHLLTHTSGMPDFEVTDGLSGNNQYAQEQVMESNIKLEEVNYWNYNDLIDLKVKESQRGYVASNIYSLAEAYAAVASKGYALPFGIYLEDKPIGFLMIGYYPDLEYARYAFGDEDEIPDYVPCSYLIWRFMIDQEYQGKGYGREAFRLALEYIKTYPCGKADYCWLSYEPENDAARKLYASFGFEEKQMPEGWDEVPAVLKL